MNRVLTWIMAGAIAAGTGCATPAKADDGAAPRAAQQAEAEAARAQAQSARADAMLARQEAMKEKELAEVHARLARLQDGQRVRMREVKKEKVAYLGITTSQVPTVMRKQVKLLPRGFGLVVDSVGKDSAAEQGGIQQYDILMRFDDQKLVNSQQLGVLVREKKAGDQVKFSLIRQGEPQEVTVTLQEKEMAVTDDGPFGFIYRNGEGDLNELDDTVWTTLAAPVPLTPETPIPPAFGGVELLPGGAVNSFRISGLGENRPSTCQYTDGEITLSITEDDEGKQLLAKDSQDQILFSGPIVTTEQRAKLPRNVAEKLEKFEKKLEKLSIGNKKGSGVNITIVDQGGEGK